ncbi:hypothetical protein NUACC21_78740 [Scytonema sp. NUACC21]
MIESITSNNALIIPDYLVETSQWECEDKPNYKIYRSGSHLKSNFIQLYVPNNPYYDEQGKTKAVIYMHGFALCMPKFYEQHLQELVKKGYYVFFPDFQKSNYPNDVKTDETLSEKEDLVDLSEVIKFIEETYKLISKGRVKSVLRKITVAAINIRFFLALSLIIGLIATIYYFVDRKYGKHLIKLIRTVRFSLFDSPLQWIGNAVQSTEEACQMLHHKDSNFKIEETDFYLFGHSLGGLLSLSWISYLNNQSKDKSKFYPKQIVVADPAPSTSLGIPKTVMFVLQLFKSKFTTGAVDIKRTGYCINVPVAILHGDDDKLVKPKVWYKPSLFNKKSNFDYIESEEKKIYFSLSDKANGLFAVHNQAVTDTTYFSDNLFRKFGGSKHQADAYNYEYIWPALDLVIEKQFKASELLDKFPLEKIKVVDKLPVRR